MLEGRAWYKVDGAAPKAIAALKSVAPVKLPDTYYSLLSYSNGGEGPFAIQPFWLCLYPAEEVVQIEQDGTFREFFKDLLIIGGNGGGEAVAFDLKQDAPYPIISFDMCNINLTESVKLIAPTFDDFVALIGVDKSN